MDYFVDANVSVGDLAASVYSLVCRQDFSAPGFALVRQSQVTDSLTHRSELVSGKLKIDQFGRNGSPKVDHLAAGRFNPNLNF